MIEGDAFCHKLLQLPQITVVNPVLFEFLHRLE